MTPWPTRSVVLVVLAAALSVSACGDGGEAELEALRSGAVAGILTAVAGDSVIRLASGDTLRVSPTTMAFYREREWKTAWVDSEGLLGQGALVHDALGRSWEDGLPTVRYRHDVAGKVLTRLEEEGDRELSDSLAVRNLAEIDVLLTEGFHRFAIDLVAGMLDPEKAGLDYRIAKDVAPDDAYLRRVVAGEPPADVIAELRPSIPQYERMRAALLGFHEIETRGAWPRLEPDSALREGGRSDMVATLRQRLTSGIDEQEGALARAGDADPTFFDADLKRAVQRFQDRHAIEPDGVVGEGTMRELNHTVTELIAELRLNLDRWRWLPDDLGERYVLVNVAGFELEVVENGRVIEAMDVVVGDESTETPMFSDSIRFVVVNPYWNVPDGIMERKIAPAMAADPSYLDDHDMEIVDGRVRQRPGPQNSLGRYKFIFPNDLDIYLHDTPDGHLFSRMDRSFSSGCVRIERPRDFARLLLRLQSDLDPESLDAILATGEERWLKLDRPLPVYLMYFTAWAQDDGSVRFHHDVYGRSQSMDGQAEEMKAPPRISHGPDAAPPDDGRRTGRRG